MSKRPTSTSFPALSEEVENTPSTTPAPVSRPSPAVPKPNSNPYYFPPDSDDSDSDDESSSDESLDHGGDMGPTAPPAVDAVAPAPAPEHPQPPSRPASPVAPARPPSPVGIGARLPRRTRNKPREWWKLSAAQLDSNIDDDIEEADLVYKVAYSFTAAAESLSYSEALRHPDAEQWKQAALEELNAHSTNGTWELVPRRKGKTIIGSKWIFKVKRNADGSVERYKGRLVAKGYNQSPGFDYLEIFAPTECLQH